jgi:Oxidoreductase-like protein, N-terminal
MSPSVPDPPIRPEAYECCNRGCCPCIFDYYEDALERWKGMVAARGLDPEAVLAAQERPQR